MSDAAAPLPLRGSAHLTTLVTEVDALAARLRATVAAAAPDTIAARRSAEDRASAEASLTLDGGLRSPADGGDIERDGTWLDALRDAAGGEADPPEVDAALLETLAAAERTGAAAGIAADELADAFGRASADAAGLGAALGLLHGRITAGLVAPERAGRLRRGPRVVHDASVGRVLFFPTDPGLLPDAWDGLLRHVTGSGAGAAAARTPPAVRAALLHLELLRHQPFDAANGRLARAAARLALLADGLLPAALGAADVVLAEDPLGYHAEVGASVRRRDATAWVERALEAQTVALIRTVDALDATVADGAVPSAPPGEVDDAALTAGAGEVFTLADVMAATGTTSDAARERCSGWVVAGRAVRVVGSGGLRLTRR